MRLAITGHRPARIKGREDEIRKWLIQKYKDYHPEDILTGMAQGTDQIAAWAAKDEGFFYTCAFPYKRALHPAEQALVDGCARVIWCADKYDDRETFTKRDQFMIDHADKVLAVWDGKPNGGTYRAIEYAKSCGKEVIYFPWTK